MGRELEVKLRVDCEEQLDQVLAWPELRAKFAGQPEKILMQTVYYDTKDNALATRKWALRRRLENNETIVCVKTVGTTYGGISDRGEWQINAAPTDEIPRILPALVAQGAPEELLTVCAQGVERICGAEFLRRATLLHLENCTCELAADSGILLGRQSRQPFYELELELKSGVPEAMFALCRKLEEAFALQEEPKSKFQRARELD